MKLMKRILAIVCTFVMIISMATGVNAVNDTSTTATAAQTKGSITITNAKAGEEYKVYKILSLESYDPSIGAYSYVKNPAGDKWNAFVNDATDYLDINNDNYVTFKSDKSNEAGAREFALKAMDYAKANQIEATDSKTASEGKDTDITVQFNDLPLGYYLVSTSVGTACSIDTTHPNLSVRDKHDAPTINKEIVRGDGLSGTITDNGKKNSVNIGDVVAFKVTINVKPYAKNYVLHDLMDEHLQLLQVAYVRDNENHEFRQGEDFIVKPDKLINPTKPTDKCTFELSFTEQFYKTYREDIDNKKLTTITIQYVAQVKDDAPINIPMPNKAHLTYGEHSTTDESVTNTYTWGIPVYKYTENAGKKEALAGAKFILSTEEIPTETNALKFSRKETDYRYNSISGIIQLESPKNGMINIQGLKSGTYYLKETKAPDGYNVLKTPIKIVVEGDETTGQRVIKVDKNGIATVVERVEVQNNKGSILPSTGGMGTTLIYVVGSILVLASGIVLFSKRKEGTN